MTDTPIAATARATRRSCWRFARHVPLSRVRAHTAALRRTLLPTHWDIALRCAFYVNIVVYPALAWGILAHRCLCSASCALLSRPHCHSTTAFALLAVLPHLIASICVPRTASASTSRPRAWWRSNTNNSLREVKRANFVLPLRCDISAWFLPRDTVRLQPGGVAVCRYVERPHHLPRHARDAAAHIFTTAHRTTRGSCWRYDRAYATGAPLYISISTYNSAARWRVAPAMDGHLSLGF